MPNRSWLTMVYSHSSYSIIGWPGLNSDQWQWFTMPSGWFVDHGHWLMPRVTPYSWTMFDNGYTTIKFVNKVNNFNISIYFNNHSFYSINWTWFIMVDLTIICRGLSYLINVFDKPQSSLYMFFHFTCFSFGISLQATFAASFAFCSSRRRRSLGRNPGRPGIHPSPSPWDAWRVPPIIESSYCLGLFENKSGLIILGLPSLMTIRELIRAWSTTMGIIRRQYPGADPLRDSTDGDELIWSWFTRPSRPTRLVAYHLTIEASPIFVWCDGD